MNKDRIEKLAEAVESTPAKDFNMCSLETCIVGVAVRVFPEEMDGNWSCSGSLARLLDITQEQASDLAISTPGADDLRTITTAQAGAVLRRLAATGQVNWKQTP